MEISIWSTTDLFLFLVTYKPNYSDLLSYPWNPFDSFDGETDYVDTNVFYIDTKVSWKSILNVSKGIKYFSDWK